ncbi:MAG: thioredoxin family protein [Candidatus Kapaibacteriales bacterium]
MPAVQSSSFDLGAKLPRNEFTDFRTGNQFNLGEAKPSVLMVVSRHCPYVKHISQKLYDVIKTYDTSNIDFVAITSNDIVNYPDDSPALLVQDFDSKNVDAKIVYDEDQSIAKELKAECTPEFFVFNGENECFYRGRFDSSNPGNSDPITGEDLKNAIDRVLIGSEKPDNQLQSIGCSIKWK